jgi:hypothetical protein
VQKDLSSALEASNSLATEHPSNHVTIRVTILRLLRGANTHEQLATAQLISAVFEVSSKFRSAQGGSHAPVQSGFFPTRAEFLSNWLMAPRTGRVYRRRMAPSVPVAFDAVFIRARQREEDPRAKENRSTRTSLPSADPISVLWNLFFPFSEMAVLRTRRTIDQSDGDANE